MDTWPTPPGPFEPTAAEQGRSALTRIGGHLHLQFLPADAVAPLERAIQAYVDELNAPPGATTLPVPNDDVAELRAAAGQR